MITKKVKLHIKAGDRVKVLAGKHKGEKGEVLKVLPLDYRAIVKGLNVVVRHLKPSTKNPLGMIEKKEAPIHISNLMLIDPSTGHPTRVGRKHNASGKLQRYSKKTGNFIRDVKA